NQSILSPNGKLLASLPTRSGYVTILDAVTGNERFSIPTPIVAEPVVHEQACTPAWDPSGRRLAMGGNDGMVRVWLVGARRAWRSAVESGMPWSQDGRNVLCVTNRTRGILGGPDKPLPDSTFQIRDAITGEEKRTLVDPGKRVGSQQDTFTELAESPDG